MHKSLKLVALMAAVTVAVWALTIWHWQRTQRMVTTSDLVLYLLVLPLLAVVALWAGRRALSRRAGTAVAVPAGAAAASASAAGAAAPTAAAQDRPQPALVLASALTLSIATDAAGALAALAEAKTLPELDPQLRDDEGFPLLTARAADLDTAPVDAALQDLLPALVARQPQWQGLEPSPAFVRALALLEAPLQEVLEACAAEWQAQQLPPDSLAPGRGARLAPAVALVWALPQHWSEPEQALARLWLHRTLKAQPLPQDVWQVQVHAAGSAEALFVHVEQQFAAWRREQRPGLLVALACDSSLDEARVQLLLREGALQTSRQPKGVVPGEAGAAVLLATPTWPVTQADPARVPRLQPVAIRRRDKSADAAGRIDGSTLAQAAETAMGSAALEPAQCGRVISDVDLRASRSSELADVMLQHLPDLDAGEQVVRLGLACGDLGVARGLCCLALAAESVRSEEQPVLVTTAMHPHDRAAFALTLNPEPGAGAGPAA
ncbi:hypothetical protein [Caldimonas brevitalea]|uniref:Transmembrane protein n=1 Tax=Caldimonas brevitalea TaxID=413882 RepID=A0A0G3BGI6_9BURK|nr:hypothetical protein [Caldimonas brevitalea]AKJ28544.1 transmembrane protein [Caldimonas brevitalea]